MSVIGRKFRPQTAACLFSLGRNAAHDVWRNVIKNPFVICALLLATASAHAQKTDLVDFGMMTWPEVKQALEHGKTTALIYNGGTEQRGPQNVNGGHTLMGQATVLAIAHKLGNAISAPVMPFSPNDADPELPGTIGLTPPLFAALNEQVAEQMIKNGFKNIVLMGDHGGGQKEWAKSPGSWMKNSPPKAFA